MRLCDGLRHDLLDPEIDENARGENAGFEVGAYRHDGSRKLGDSELAQRFFARRVRLDDVGEDAGKLLDDPRVGVDPEHLVTHAHERRGEASAEAAKADDDELPGCLTQ